MRNRFGLYSEARKRASSKPQAPSPRNARLQVRASAREAVAATNVLESFPKDPNTGGDAKALSDDAISTDPTRCTIDYGDEALVNPNDKAVDNGEDDDGNEDINGVKDNEGEDDENDGDDDGAGLDDVHNDDKEDNNEKEDDAYDVDKDEDEDEDEDEDKDADEDEDKDDEEDGEEDDEEDEDEDDDEDDVDYQDVPCDNDDDNELYSGLLFYDDNDGDLNLLEGGKYRVPSVHGKGGGRQPNPNRPPKAKHRWNVC